MKISYDDGTNLYEWTTTIEQGRGLCDKNMLVITPDNFLETNPNSPEISFYNQDHPDNYFTLTYYECETNLAVCGEVFQPDCDTFGKAVCCGDVAGEYLINGRCCNSPTDTLDAQGNCIPKPTKKPPVSEIQQP
jgi:hypothetical protein